MRKRTYPPTTTNENFGFRCNTPIHLHGPLDTRAATIKVGTANGKVETSAAKANLPIPQLAAYFPTTEYIIPYFTNTLIGAGPIFDANCTLLFKKKDVKLLSTGGKPIIRGWREKKLPRLWCFPIKPINKSIKEYKTTNQKSPAAHIAYDLPSIEALVRYMHAAAGFPVKPTWLKETKKGNFET